MSIFCRVCLHGQPFISSLMPRQFGTELAHQSPEILAVIHKDQVAKLVEADVINALSAENDKL